MPHLPSRRGPSRLGVLVAIVVVLALAAIILPAMQDARETARRTQCLTNLHHLSVSLQSYASTQKRLPSYGTWGVGESGQVEQRRSWVVDLMPYMASTHIADSWDRSLSWDAQADPDWIQFNWGVLSCPSDESAYSSGRLSYVVNAGCGDASDVALGNHHFSRESFDWNADGVVNGPGIKTGADDFDSLVTRSTGLMWADHENGRANKSYSLDTVFDGASNTILLTENLNAGSEFGDPTSWANPDPRNCAFFYPLDPAKPSTAFTNAEGRVNLPAYLSTGNGPFINQNKSGPEGNSPYPSSGHPGGVNILYVEGEARFLSEDIDRSIYFRLITPAATRQLTTAGGLELPNEATIEVDF